MTIFPTFFFLENIGKEKVFYDILERKNAFLGYINKKFKKSKSWKKRACFSIYRIPKQQFGVYFAFLDCNNIHFT